MMRHPRLRRTEAKASLRTLPTRPAGCHAHAEGVPLAEPNAVSCGTSNATGTLLAS
jgi:hypothetical protein